MPIISRIQTYLRKKAESALACHSCAPFSVLAKQPGDPFDFAIPDRPLVDGLDQVITELQVHALARHAKARVQFIEEFAPAFAAALRKAGFGEVWRSRIMACDPQTLGQTPDVPGLTIAVHSADTPLDELRLSWITNALGFGEPGEVGDEALHNFRRDLVSGRAFLVKVGGQPAGACMYTDLRQGVTEMVGITTLEAFRGRGVAAAMTAYAARTAFENGADLVFLGTNSEQAARIYERIGFQTYGWLVEFSENPAEWAKAGV